MVKKNAIIRKMEITVVRSRRKTLSLSVTREGKVLVRAPLSIKDEEIKRFIQREEEWLNRRLTEYRMREKLLIEDGATLTLFGKTYRIASGKTRAKENVLYLPQEGREASLTRFLKKLTLQTMTAWTEEYALIYKLKFQRVRVGSARGRWGSCNAKKEIIYSFRCAFLPVELSRYIVVHELCHTKYLNHGANFWQEVCRILPDWKSRRSALKSCVYYMDFC